MDAFVGEIRLMGFSFAPKGWAYCQGQLLPIQQNQALFSLLGTTYGGNGTTTFALPDLRSRAIVGNGQGTGLSPYMMGQQGGQDGVALQSNQMPAHTHTFNGSILTADETTAKQPSGAYPSAAGTPATTPYSTGTANATLNAAALPNVTTAAGGSQPHENRQPLLALNYAIALTGYFPSRQ
jgi:microcystin-dependent protein